jgi:hypothetical protein
MAGSDPHRDRRSYFGKPALSIESVFTDGGPGWRAAQTGEQRIRLILDESISVRRIQPRFCEPAIERKQEFTLHWSPVQGGTASEIIRQQWNFNPCGSTLGRQVPGPSRHSIHVFITQPFPV